MRIETLIVTVNGDARSLVEKMNIRTDAIVGNQCGKTGEERFSCNGHTISCINSDERGVGRNRNALLERMTAELCILADDDMQFEDNCPETAEKAFADCPDADIIVFNLIEKTPKRYVIEKISRIGKHDYAKFGAARIAFKRNAIASSGVKFSTLFGGGAVYGSGEDTIFLRDCLKKGLRIYAVPYALAQIDNESESTWFNGYNEKFFHDKGALYACLHPHAAAVFCARFILKYRKKFPANTGLAKSFGYMLNGIREYTLRGERTSEK